MEHDETVSAPIHSRSANGCATWGFSIMGGLLLVFGFLFHLLVAIVGAVFILIAILLDKRQHICGACGNHVAETSTLCPTCHTQLYIAQISVLRILVIMGWITLFLGLGIGAFWLVRNS